MLLFNNSLFASSGLLGPSALSMNSSTAQNTLLNALNSSVSPLHSPSSAAPSPTLWATSLANTANAGTESTEFSLKCLLKIVLLWHKGYFLENCLFITC